MAGREGVFLTADWRALLMINFEVDPDLLSAHLPPGTTLDSWQGRHFVSMVGFRFLNTRVLGRRIPFHTDFDEVNLRFYVRRKAEDGWRRGVVFLKEIVPRRAIAWVARIFYGEKYGRLPMRSEVALPAVGGRGFVRFEWKHAGRWNSMEAGVAGGPEPCAPGSEEEFITEHYWGYAGRRGGTTEYRVEHPRWQVWRALEPALDCDADALYGSGFAQALAQPPSSAFVADGSAVTVRRGNRMETP